MQVKKLKLRVHKIMHGLVNGGANPDLGAFCLMLAQLREGSGTIKAEKSGGGGRASVKRGDAGATLILSGSSGAAC